MKAIIIYGISGSGKTTKAKSLLTDDMCHIERDMLRFGSEFLNLGNWKEYNINSQTEFIVDSLWKTLICLSSYDKTDIIISDTLCKLRDRVNLNSLLTFLGYDVEFIRMNLPCVECIKRDSFRKEFSVGPGVIFKQHEHLVKHQAHI